nr:riboflavin biosynthesis protein RibF [Bacilli bacterium]
MMESYIDLRDRDHVSMSPDSKTMAIGKFDGLHAGHQAVLSLTVDLAKVTSTKPCLFCFDPHPRFALTGDENYRSWLTPAHERDRIARRYGISQTFVAHFDEAFRKQTAEDFVRDYLVALHVSHLVVGDDFHLGKNKAYDVHDLQRIAATYGIDVNVVNSITEGSDRVSSTRIRQSLAKGDVMGAASLLRRPYQLCGTVVHGKALGRTIGYPTANLSLDEPYVVPKIGVYLVESHLLGKRIFGMMNIGFRPTVSDQRELSLEVHFFDQSFDLYGQSICLLLLDHLRDEVRFESVQALTDQLARDEVIAKSRLLAFT